MTIHSQGITFYIKGIGDSKDQYKYWNNRFYKYINKQWHRIDDKTIIEYVQAYFEYYVE